MAKKKKQTRRKLSVSPDVIEEIDQILAEHFSKKRHAAAMDLQRVAKSNDPDHYSFIEAHDFYKQVSGASEVWSSDSLNGLLNEEGVDLVAPAEVDDVLVTRLEKAFLASDKSEALGMVPKTTQAVLDAARALLLSLSSAQADAG